eukprot:10513166-Alexandrium_andersonii.AAC.1
MGLGRARALRPQRPRERGADPSDTWRSRALGLGPKGASAWAWAAPKRFIANRRVSLGRAQALRSHGGLPGCPRGAWARAGPKRCEGGR